jgi:hypothetical protein
MLSSACPAVSRPSSCPGGYAPNMKPMVEDDCTKMT